MVSGQTRFRGKGPLFALDVASGEQLWTHDFGDVSAVGQASVVNCRIYIQNSAGMAGLPSRIWSLRADTGEPVWSRIVPSQLDRYGAPAVDENRVYVNAGSYGGLFAYARMNGTELFRDMTVGQSGQWVAALHGADVYTLVGGNLRRHTASTGAVLDTISVKGSSIAPAQVVGPVLSAEGIAYFVVRPTLYAFELSTKKLLWSQAANLSGMPALAEGRVLAFDSQLLSSFDAKTGALQWRSLEAEGLVQAPVVAAGYAYASSESATYAFDLRDGSVVWKANFGGWLSIGRGHLFIAGADGILHSYRLTQPGTADLDAGTPDAGAPDAGASDADASDTGASDADASDADASDTGAPELHGG
jgi:outer membrane protein assembly factor BamB